MSLPGDLPASLSGLQGVAAAAAAAEAAAQIAAANAAAAAALAAAEQLAQAATDTKEEEEVTKKLQGTERIRSGDREKEEDEEAIKRRDLAESDEIIEEVVSGFHVLYFFFSCFFYGAGRWSVAGWH